MHAGCLHLSHRRPPEMCGLRTRPRTDGRRSAASRIAIGGIIASPPPGDNLFTLSFIYTKAGVCKCKRNFQILISTARCYASAVLAVALCLSGLSVRPSQLAVLLKWLNVGSYKQHHTIAQGLLFSDAKDLREIRPGPPPAGRQMQVGWVKIGDFRQIAGYILKTVKIDALFLLKSNRKSYALYRMVVLPMTLSAPDHSKPQHFLHFAPPFIVS